MRVPKQIVCAVVPLLASCSLLGESDQATTHRMKSVEITLSRASLVGVDYEHYKIARGKLFKECGKVNKGNFIPDEQAFVSLNPDIHAPLLDVSHSFMARAHGQEIAWDKPGKNDDLTDPGITRVVLEAEEGTVTVDTALDSVSNPGSRAERSLNNLIRIVRSAAGTMCGNKVFYGVGV